MVKKIQILLAAVCLVLLIAIPLLLFVYSSQRVSIENRSSTYSVSYAHHEEFMDFLEKWGVWKGNNISLDNSINAYTVDKLRVIVTDEIQRENTLIDSSSPPNIIAGTSSEVKDSTWYLYVYLSPELDTYIPEIVVDGLKDPDGIFLWAVISSVYLNTHMVQSKEHIESYTAYSYRVIDDLKKNNANPFQVSRIK